LISFGSIRFDSVGWLVQVADVKRANGLTTDLQMFAHKTLRVPLHGRHPPAASAPSSSSPSRAHRTRCARLTISFTQLQYKPPHTILFPQNQGRFFLL
jgi:hypothetical protein